MASIPASIHFLSRLPIYREEKPYAIRYNLPKDSAVLRTNAYHEETQNVSITDLRGRESLFTLSQHGFCVIKYETNMTHQDFADEERVEEVYLPGVARRLRELLDAKHVQVYEHIVRRSRAGSPPGLCTDPGDSEIHRLGDGTPSTQYRRESRIHSTSL